MYSRIIEKLRCDILDNKEFALIKSNDMTRYDFEILDTIQKIKYENQFPSLLDDIKENFRPEDCMYIFNKFYLGVLK